MDEEGGARAASFSAFLNNEAAPSSSFLNEAAPSSYNTVVNNNQQDIRDTKTQSECRSQLNSQPHETLPIHYVHTTVLPRSACRPQTLQQHQLPPTPPALTSSPTLAIPPFSMMVTSLRSPTWPAPFSTKLCGNIPLSCSPSPLMLQRPSSKCVWPTNSLSSLLFAESLLLALQ
jgi:hypothetical protein